MFTGIVADVGTLKSSLGSSSSKRMVWATSLELSTFELGESIAVNGVCLTVDDIGTDSFATDVSPETLNRSNLGGLRMGQPVNLERALRPVDRLGGHFVLGHVDGGGKLSARRREGEFEVLTFSAPSEVLRYTVEKGSIAVDGISLTVASVIPEGFTVAAIPHTLGRTTLAAKKVGDGINLEADVLGKYVEKLMGRGKTAGLTFEALAQGGFLK